jgi:hypothetical protein
MADMTASAQQWVAAFGLLVAALFVSAGLPIAPQWRRRLRIAAIGVFFLAMVVAIFQAVLWLADGSR